MAETLIGYLFSGSSDQILENYNPHDWINTPKNKLVLAPFSYPKCGCYTTHEEELNVYPAIINFSIEEQMKYSDAISRRYALNPHFLKIQKDGGSFDVERTINHIKNQKASSSIGNIAFLAYHNGINSDWGEFYTKVLNSLK